MDAAKNAMAAETDRAGFLQGRSEKLTAGVIVVMGFQLMSASNVLGSGFPWAAGLYYSALAIISPPQ